MEGRKTSRSEPARESGASSAVYELFIFALTIFSLLVLVAYWLPPVSAVTRQALFRIDILLSLIFLVDSFRSLFRAPDKWAYLKWGWLDFLGSVPAVIPLRFARLARLLRAWRVVRTRRPRQVLREFERDRAQGVLLVTIFMAVMVLTMASILVLELESRAPDANIHSGADAFWWAFGTITTVAYGDRYPVTFLGRIVAMALMTVGVGLFGVLASYLAAAFVTVGRVEQEDIDLVRDDLAAVKDDLATIQAELAAIKALLLLKERDLPHRERE